MSEDRSGGAASQALKLAKLCFLETRPPFLLVTVVSVLVGAATAFLELGSLNVPHLLLALVGALLAHISVNVLNDYFDFESGIDLHTLRTPFSGGSGFLPAGTLKPRQVYLLGMLSFLALVPIGGYFLLASGLGLLPLGIGGMLLVFFYTTHITKRPWLCLVAPGLGFGPLMVLGTYFTQAGRYSWSAGLASLVVGCLVSDLLLLNQFPDVEADKLAARRHLPIMMGIEWSAWAYVALLVGAYGLIALGAVTRLLPVTALAGLLTLPLGLSLVRGVPKYHGDLGKLVPLMGLNVMVTLALPLLLAVGIVVGGLL